MFSASFVMIAHFSGVSLLIAFISDSIMNAELVSRKGDGLVTAVIGHFFDCWKHKITRPVYALVSYTLK